MRTPRAAHVVTLWCEGGDYTAPRFIASIEAGAYVQRHWEISLTMSEVSKHARPLRPPRSELIGAAPAAANSTRLGSDAVDLPLFRQEVLGCTTSQWMGRITLSQPVSSWLLSMLAFSFAASALILLCVATYTRHESVQGELIPSAGLLPVIARSTGTVMTTLIHEGEVVTKDQALVELSGEVSSLTRGQTQVAVLGDLKAQLKELEALLENQQRLGDQQQAGLTERIRLLNKQLTEIDGQLSTQRQVTGITELRLEKL